MADKVSSTRSLLFFNEFTSSEWNIFYLITIFSGMALIGGLSYYISDSVYNKNYDAANSATWYLVVTGIYAFFMYGFFRRSMNRNIQPSWLIKRPNLTIVWGLFMLAFSPAYAFIEIWDKIYLGFRKIFKGDKEELDQTTYENIKQKLNKYSFFRTIDLDTSERFTYLFGNLSYDRQDSGSIFRDGTDIVRTPVLVSTFFVALCLLIPIVITAANGEKLTQQKWEKNIAPVTTIISGLVLVFVLGTVQGYGDTATIEREKLYKGKPSKFEKETYGQRGKGATSSSTPATTTATPVTTNVPPAPPLPSSKINTECPVPSFEDQISSKAIRDSDNTKKIMKKIKYWENKGNSPKCSAQYANTYSPRKPRRKSPVKKMKKQKK